MTLAADLHDRLHAPGGDPSLRCLALLHGAAVVGRFDAVELLLDEALALAVPPERLEAAGLQVAPYGGFPRALETLGLVAARREGPARSPADDRPRDDLPAAGRDTFERVYADSTEAVLGQLEALHPGLSAYVLEAAYGQVLARPGLTLGEREMLAVSALALAALPAPLGSHVRGALRNGYTASAVEDILLASSVLADERANPVIAQALDRLSRKVYRP